MDSSTALTYEQYLKAANGFIEISDRIGDGWKLNLLEPDKVYLEKETFMQSGSSNDNIIKAHYVIYFNFSYRVPSFSFNLWNASGMLLSLVDLRSMANTSISEKDFYSVITQQEHPILHKPYFIMHPCHTETLLDSFKNKSKNIIVTFLGLITPLIRFNLPVEYGL